jgi:hypothetical protein
MKSGFINGNLGFIDDEFIIDLSLF